MSATGKQSVVSVAFNSGQGSPASEGPILEFPARRSHSISTCRRLSSVPQAVGRKRMNCQENNAKSTSCHSTHWCQQDRRGSRVSASGGVWTRRNGRLGGGPRD